MKGNKFYDTLHLNLNGGFMELLSSVFWFIVIMGGAVGALFFPIMYLISPFLLKKEVKRLNALNEALEKELAISLQTKKRFHRENEDFRFYYGRMSEKYNELRESCKELLYPRNRYLSTHEGNIRNLHEVYVRQES
tara:strand:+ start:298 stop:705 length:408 start_codon:yes stop_codon:yes gene_type:complete